jgi:aspartyl protease family protein
MQQKGIIILFGLALLFGWLAPDADLSAPSADKASGKLARVQADGTGNESVFSDDEIGVSSSDGIVLKRQEDGHFYAAVDVDGTEIRFMIDTGASGLALTGDDAEALGLSWNDSELEIVGRGVSGNVYGKRVMLRSVELGGLQASNVEASIIPNGLDVSLLGQSFLSKAGSVKIENDAMVLS